MEIVDSDPRSVVLRISQDELGTLNNALNEILHGPDAIEEWEFHARVGATRDEARSLLDQIGYAYQGFLA